MYGSTDDGDIVVCVAAANRVCCIYSQNKQMDCRRPRDSAQALREQTNSHREASQSDAARAGTDYGLAQHKYIYMQELGGFCCRNLCVSNGWASLLSVNGIERGLGGVVDFGGSKHRAKRFIYR